MGRQTFPTLDGVGVSVVGVGAVGAVAGDHVLVYWTAMPSGTSSVMYWQVVRGHRYTGMVDLSGVPSVRCEHPEVRVSSCV